MILFAALACAVSRPGTPNKNDTGEPPVLDSASLVDSGVDSAADSAPDTASDSAVDPPAQPGDAENQPCPTVSTDGGAIWVPGDPVPGWCDYPCDAEFELPAGADEAPVSFESGKMYVQLNDYGALSSQSAINYGSDGHLDADDAPRWLLGFGRKSSAVGTGVSSRQQGWYYLDDAELTLWYRDEAHGIRWVDIEDNETPSEGWRDVRPYGVCISRFRPDHIRGWAWFDLTAEPLGSFDSWLFVRIDLVLAEHAAQYATEYVYPQLTPEQSALMFYYSDWQGITYDNAWPWDEITDPDLRQQLYDLYTPLRE